MFRATIWLSSGQAERTPRPPLPIFAVHGGGCIRRTRPVRQLLAACEQGRRVRYTTAARVDKLVEATDDRDLSRAAGRYGRLDLPCLDNW